MKNYVISVLHECRKIEIASFRYEFFDLGCLFFEWLKENDDRHVYLMEEKEDDYI